MKVLESGFNLNWFEFEFVSSLSIEELANHNISIFPNPVKGNFKIQLNDNNEVKALRRDNISYQFDSSYSNFDISKS